MNINFTIFVQIFHFLIAYAFLSKFLFRPILKLFIKEKEKIVKLNQHITIEQEKLSEKELLAAQNWSLCKTHFQENLPQPENAIVVTKLDTTTIQKPPVLTTEEIQNVVNVIESDIKPKVML